MAKVMGLTVRYLFIQPFVLGSPSTRKLMKNNNNIILLSIIPLNLLLVACGSTPERSSTQQPLIDDVPYQVTEDYTSGVISYTIQRGDRLADIALEFTGLSSNWREIANYNNIANPRSLSVGAVLDIPTHLIPGYQRPTPAPIIQAQPVLTAPVAQTSSLGVRRNQPTNVAPVVVTPINTNRNFDLNPIDSSTQTQSRSYAGGGAQVKVSGSYYPKSVYAGPDYASKMIQRVSPGTLFVLESQVNEWYKIQTNAGTGYIRTSDAAIVE